MTALVALLLAQAQAPTPTPVNYMQWIEYIKPSAEECRFELADWHPVLWNAVIEANRDDKPILLWAMNGHPMGCT